MGTLEVKAYNLRATLDALEERGWLATVRAAVSADARRLLDDPPPSSAWIDGMLSSEPIAAVHATYGPAATREFIAATIKRGALRFLRPVLEGALRLFGATPGTLFSRLGTITPMTARGLNMQFEATGPRGGRITVVVDAPRPIPPSFWLTIVAGFEDIFALTSTPGVVEGPVVAAPQDGTHATFVVRW